MSLNIKTTFYGDLERIVERAYKDIEGLNNLIKYTKNIGSKAHYSEMIQREQNRINRYEKMMSELFNLWSNEMKIIWSFGDFIFYCENEKPRGIF